MVRRFAVLAFMALINVSSLLAFRLRSVMRDTILKGSGRATIFLTYSRKGGDSVLCTPSAPIRAIYSVALACE